MSPEILLPLAAFALATSITPGPNNLMLMASGTNFGFRRTLPHMLGVALGFGAMVFGVGLGAIGLLDAAPGLRHALRWGGAAYVVWLAVRIARSAPPVGRSTRGRPMSFAAAAAFQWINPKAFAMALSAVSIYAPERDAAAVAAVALVFCAVNLPSVATWAWAGQALRRVLRQRRALRLFNGAMALLLVASMLPVLLTG